MTSSYTSLSDDDLKKIVLDAGVIEQDKLQQLFTTKSSEQSLYEVLDEKDLISDANLGKLVADFYQLPFISLSSTSISQDLLTILPEEYAKKQNVIVFGEQDNLLKVATTHPTHMDVLQNIAKKTGKSINVYFATPKDLKNALTLYRKKLQSSFDELLHSELEAANASVVKETPVAKLVDLLIEYAHANKASDIHIEPNQVGSMTRFRIDGVLHDVLNLPKDLHAQVISRIKVLSKLRTDEHLSAQDGKLQIKLEAEDLDVRVSIVPIVAGEDCVLRLLSSKSRDFSLADLGVSEKDLIKIKNAYERPYGMLLVTGPTGSGKTTTIYSILKILNSREKNIDTIEDPVEYELTGVNQIQVNSKTNLTFANGLRSILRQDPDIIFVGEIRDEETADIAINSAMTGHLVLSTLHTNDAATAMPRLIDMEIEPFLVASTVNVIVAQRLVRKICASCKVSYSIERSQLVKYFSDAVINRYFSKDAQFTLYRGKGCEVCHHTGYMGRIGVYEVLEMSPAIQKLITDKADANEIKKQAIVEGMTTMNEDGLAKTQQGITTIDEVLRVTRK